MAIKLFRIEEKDCVRTIVLHHVETFMIAYDEYNKKWVIAFAMISGEIVRVWYEDKKLALDIYHIVLAELKSEYDSSYDNELQAAAGRHLTEEK